MLKKLWTTDDVAEIRNTSTRTIERERESGVGCPYVRIGSRIYYRPDDVEAFIAAHVCGGKRASAVTDPPLSSSMAPPSRRGRVRKAPTIAGGAR